MASSAIGQNATPPSGLTFVKGPQTDFAADFARGDTVHVIEFWTTWCGPCRTTIPHLSQLAQRFKDSKVVFVGVTSEDQQKAKKFVDQMGSQMDYTVVCDDQDICQREYMEKYRVQGIPHAFIVGKDGKIKWAGHPAEPGFEPALVDASRAPAVSKGPEVSKMSEEELSKLSVKDLKAALSQHGVDSSGAIEKGDLVELVKTKVNKVV